MERHLIGRINIVNMSILPKVIYSFSVQVFISSVKLIPKYLILFWSYCEWGCILNFLFRSSIVRIEKCNRFYMWILCLITVLNLLVMCVCVCVCVCVKCLEFSTYKLMSFYFFVSYLDTFYIIFLPNCPSKGFQ